MRWATQALTLVSLLPVGVPALASDDPPPYQKLRYDESYEYLDDPAAPEDFFDPIKWIGIPGVPDAHLSIGGEIRHRYDYTENPTWGDDPQDDRGAFFQRYHLHADLQLTRYFRAFGQLRSAFADGREAGPSPVEEGDLALHQAFVDLVLPLAESSEIRLRPGRQEILLGSERLVSVRDGPNIRRRFDGARLIAALPGWTLSGIAAYPVKDVDGVFRDGTNTDQALWGVYAVGGEVVPSLSADLYYLGFRDEEASYEQGSGRETRHTLGARVWGRTGPWDWNWELAYQFGRFAGAAIDAWTVATDTGYTLEELGWKPRLVLNANVASGDRDPDARSLQTFSPLFPRGNYFSQLALLGPRNFFNLHPGLELAPHSRVRVALDVSLYWRFSLNDGTYAPNGQLLRAGAGTEQRFVGTAVSASADWNASRHLSLGLAYTHVFPGGFVRATGRSEDIDFVELTATFLF